MPNDRGLSRKHVMEQCEASLKRLGLDYIDLYQCHRYDPETPLEETLRALDNLVSHGKVLYTEFGNRPPSRSKTRSCSRRTITWTNSSPASPIPTCSAAKVKKAVIPVCEREGYRPGRLSPLAQGLLTGKYKPGKPLPADSIAADPKRNMFSTAASWTGRPAEGAAARSDRGGCRAHDGATRPRLVPSPEERLQRHRRGRAARRRSTITQAPPVSP